MLFSIMADLVSKRTFTFSVFLGRGVGNRSSQISGIAIDHWSWLLKTCEVSRFYKMAETFSDLI